MDLMSDSSGSEGAEENGVDVMFVFISAYESLPGLWDPGHEHYLNKLERANAIQQLLNIYRKIEPQANASDVKLKINSLRTNYRRELRKVETSRKLGCSEAECYKPTSKYFHALEFLRKLEAPLSMSPKPTLKRAAPVEAANPAPLMHRTISASSETKSASEQTALPPLKKYARTTDLIERQNELLENLSTHLERAQQPQHAPVTVIPTIAKAWGEQLLKLDPQQRFFAEKAINDILFEASLGNLNRYSIQININETTNGFDDPRYYEHDDEDDDDPIIHDPMHA